MSGGLHGRRNRSHNFRGAAAEASILATAPAATAIPAPFEKMFVVKA